MRDFLRPYDSLNGFFSDRVETHPGIGPLDYVHIPLFILKDYFPAEFEAIKNNWSFAVVRNPYERFSSSVAQRIKMYGSKPVHEMGEDEIREEVARCISYLSERKVKGEGFLLGPEYIHFQRQVDYIYLGSDQIVKSLYALEDLAMLMSDLRVRMGGDGDGLEYDLKKKNQSYSFRSPTYKKIMHLFGPIIVRLAKFSPAALTLMIKQLFFVGMAKRTDELFSEPEVKDFVRDFYGEDIVLYEKVRGGK